METRVLKSSFPGIKGAKKERKMLEKSSQSFLGPGCQGFLSRHSDHKSRKSICSLGFYLLNARLERSNRNMPVAYCCHQCKHWWLPLSAPTGADAYESRHSDHISTMVLIRNHRAFLYWLIFTQQFDIIYSTNLNFFNSLYL